MSKQSALIGWPKYDPKRYRFAMPNTVWERKLKPVEFVILSYLCYFSSHGQSSKLTQEIVAEADRFLPLDFPISQERGCSAGSGCGQPSIG